MIRLKSLKSQGIKKLQIPSEDDSFERLEFPEEGEILIHGENESGKSTLFESIYFALFGTSLIPDRSTSSMSQLLNYQSSEGLVELKFKVDQTIYKVKRTIREKSSGNMRYSHRLEVRKPGQKPEVYKGKKDVNNQIQDELGLDGDSMLNSCFVEQKNLDRLEDSSKAKREKSISTLLNLDKFTELEEKYNSRLKELREKLENKKNQLKISKLENSKIPKAEAELAKIETKLDIRQSQNLIEEHEKEIDDTKQEIEEIKEKEEKLPDKSELKHILDSLFSDLKQKEELEQEKKDLGKIEDEIEDKKQDKKDKQKELEEELKPEHEELKQKLEEKKYREYLEELKRLYRAANHQEELEDREEDYQKQKEEFEELLTEAEEQLDQEISKRNRRSLGSVAVAVISAVLGFTASPVLYIGVVLGLVAAVFFYLTASTQKHEEKIDNAEEQKDKAEKELNKIEGKKEGSEEIEAENPEEQIEEIQTQIDELGKQFPEDRDSAVEILEELEDTDESGLEQQVQEAKEAVTEASSKIESFDERLDELDDKKEDFDTEKINDKLEELEEDVEEQIESAERLLDELEKEIELEKDADTINSTKSSLGNEIETDEKDVKSMEDLEDKIDDLKDQIEDEQENIGEKKDEFELGELEKSEEKLEELRNEQNQELGGLKTKSDELQEEIDYTEISIEDAEEELQQIRDEKQTVKYSEKIVNSAKHDIMHQVLPKTESNMARFLPILTDGKYKDVSIDQENFNIQVYDSKAGEMKQKNVFSGGTKDQFSLSLRLSFAMATLPQERGSAPDFLFLDEPIGAFDQQRKEALMELLTRGEIAENFSQIFIISHVEGLKSEINQHIKMEDGRIKQKRLKK